MLCKSTEEDQGHWTKSLGFWLLFLTILPLNSEFCKKKKSFKILNLKLDSYEKVKNSKLYTSFYPNPHLYKSVSEPAYDN